MNKVETIVQSNSNALFLIVAGAILISAIIILIAYIVHLERKVNELQKPKFGFLGKPLYPVLVVALVVGSLFYVNNLEKSPEVIQTEASRTLTADLSYTVQNLNNGYFAVFFQATPSLDGKAWGKQDDQFDFAWRIVGPVEVSKIEINKHSKDVSGFSFDLPEGNYDVYVQIVSGEEKIEKQILLSLP